LTIRVVLGEDNVLVREGVRALLDSYDDVEVVGVAADAPSLLQAAKEHQPDVVVTDIKMPPNFQLEGIDCAHTIRESHPGTGVVVLSAHDDEAYAIALLGKGQSGLAYLLKDRISQGDELVKAIREVHAGGSAVDPVIAERLSGRKDTGEHDRELLELMSQGLGYAEMAERLGTTQEAVDRRVTQAFTTMAASAGTGDASAVDELKRLHAAVVQKEMAASAFRSFVPEQVAAKLQAAGSTTLREELEATILFSDIRGYSTLAERLSPGEVAEMVGRHLAAMAEVIQGHGGMVDQFVGDAVMAVFGAPDPVEDHAARAIRCALAMQARQADMNSDADSEGRTHVTMGIGINTGRVVAGTVGGAGRLEYTVVGDAVNVAARLQSEAGAGEIVASDSTVAAANGVEVESIGPRQVKGREEPVEAFRVLAWDGEPVA
jgi:adenylate cyclase